MKKSHTVGRQAFTLVELFVVAAVMCILVTIFLPQWVRQQRRHHYHVSCSNNLRQVGLAFRTWAIDNNDRFPMQVSVTNGWTR